MTNPIEKGPIEEAIAIAKARWERKIPPFEDNVERMIQIIKRRGQKHGENGIMTLRTSNDPEKGFSAFLDLDAHTQYKSVEKGGIQIPDRIYYFDLIQNGPPLNSRVASSDVIRLTMFIRNSEKVVHLTVNINKIPQAKDFEKEMDPKHKIIGGNNLMIESKEADLGPETRAFLDSFTKSAMDEMEKL